MDYSLRLTMHINRLITLFVIIYFTSIINTIAIKGQPVEINSIDFQEVNKYLESLREPDHDLINGRVLMPSRLTTYGHPYLGEDEFVKGFVTVNNKNFNDVDLKYDVVNQNVVVEYTYRKDLKRAIVLNNEFIQGFTINNKHFEYIDFPGEGKKIMQVLPANALTCYYYYFKTAEEKPEGRYLVIQIHPTKTRRYIKLQDDFIQYKSNRSFRKIFDEKYKTEIKKYLKSRRLSVKIISDEEMKLLLQFCDELITN